MTTRITRQQAGAANNKKLQLRNGKQITLAKWMTLQHVPEYGIVGKKLPLHNDATENSAENTVSADSVIASSSDRVTASSLKAKKDAAIDSKFAPTTQEIYGHVRYLSEEGMKLITRDIDECARESLRYSAISTAAKGAFVDNDKGGSKSVNNLKTLAEEIHHYIDMFQPDDQDYSDRNHTLSNTSETSSDEADLCKEILADMIHCRSRNYNPSLLPFITIKCYPNLLDRSEMTKVLSEDLSKQNNNFTTTKSHNADTKRPSSTTPPSSSSCVVTLNSTSNLVQQGHLIAEILSQCISKDPNGEQYAMELTRQRKRLKSQISRIDIDEAPRGDEGVASIFTSVWSWTDSLVNWCSTVECFDSIIVLLEDIENIASPTLDTFLTTLISLRSFHGVPINVVLMDSIPGGLGDRLSKLRNPSNHDSGGGDGGIAAYELELPLPQTQFDIFVNKLFFSGKCIPSFLWTDQRLWSHTLELFHEFDNSVMSLARHMKTELRRYFAVPGAFLTLLHCKDFVVPNESRLKWLFGEESSRRFLSIQQAPLSAGKKKPNKDEEKKEDGYVIDLFRKIQVSSVCHQLLQKIYTIFESTPVNETRLSNFAQSNIQMLVPKLIQYLHIARQKLGAQDTDSEAMQTKLDEYIILLLHIIREEESNSTMIKALLEDIINWVEECFPFQIVLGEALPPSIQPRRDVARALVLPLPKAFSTHCLSLATRTAFQVFQSRVMTLSDWYNKYFEVMTESGTDDSSETAFFFAVYELVHMGFVQKMVTGKRSEETYEKIAIVWGSGR